MVAPGPKRYSVDIGVFPYLLIATMLTLPFLYAQADTIPSAEKSRVLAALNNPDWEERNSTLHSLDIAYVTDPEVSAALIQLFDTENKDYLIRRQGPIEAWAHYYRSLIKIVGKTGDENAIPYLINSIYVAGSRSAYEALANFGDKGILAILNALDTPTGRFREVVTETIALRIAMEFIESTSTILSQETIVRLKNEMTPLTTDYSLVPAVRENAVRILGHIDDPEVISHLETLAQSDPYFLPYTIRGIKSEHGGYIIREAAKKALDKLQKSKEGGS